MCIVLDGRKKKMGVCPDGRRLILYIYIYIMIHYHDDGNEKKKTCFVLLVWCTETSG